jgi:hypothetical protein
VDERDQVRARIAFDIELDGPVARSMHGRDIEHIARRDVTRIRSRVNGDARHTSRDAHTHGVQNGRHRSASRVPKRGDLVDVD